MGRGCKVCDSRDHEQIDSLLLKRVSLRDIQRQFPFLSRAGLHRHSQKCFLQNLGQFNVTGQTIQDQLEGLWREANRLKEAAESSGDLRAALVGLKQLADLLELKMRTMPFAKQEVRLRIIESTSPIRNMPIELLVTYLEKLIRRTDNDAVMIVAAKLVFLLKGRPVPIELEAMEARVQPQPRLTQGEHP